jgi:LysR family transcriptional activator of nhaA
MPKLVKYIIIDKPIYLRDIRDMEWLNYHHLYYFWLVCTEGGFTKAAGRLRIAQSAVSLQISKLEDYLGEKLMERGPRGFKLTEAGQVTFAQADEIFRQGNDLVQYFRSGKMKASFRIGVLGGLSKNMQLRLLSSVVNDPGVELVLEVGDSQVLLDRLTNYKVDAVLSDVPFPSSEAEPLTQLEIATEPVCLVTQSSKSHKRTTKMTDELKNGIYLPAKSSPLTSAILETLKAASPSLSIRGYVDDIAFLRLLALETNSAVAIPKIGVKRELESKALTVVHEFRKIRQSYFLIHRQKGKRHPMLSRIMGG